MSSAQFLTKPRQPLISPAYPALLAYALVFFLAGLSDAVISYTTPVVIEHTLGGTFIMGLVLSTSSIAGFGFDFFLGEWFGGRSYSFFLRWMFVCALIFPLLVLFLPLSLPLFLTVMVAWGLYYELGAFSNFHFIKAHIPREHLTFGWGVLTVFKSAAYLIGPLLAGALIDDGLLFPYRVSVGLLLSGIFGFFLLQRRTRREHHSGSDQLRRVRRGNLLHEFQVWRVLFRKIWPLWLFALSVMMIDATFWSVGTVLSERLRHLHPLGGWLLTAYMLPPLFVGLLADRVSKPLGKKRTAFISGLLSGMFLLSAGMVSSVPLFLYLILLSSFFSALAWPEILATYEDFVTRIGSFGDELIGLEQTSSSLAYVFGPVLAGFFATLVGEARVFSIAGGFLLAVSLLVLIVTPRKIRMPQEELLETEKA